MKRSFFALAALAAATTAGAQPSLTIYGIVDAAFANYRGAGAGSRTQLVSGANQSSRLGFTGREDLGGGLYAGFVLEAQPDTGNGSFATTNTNNQPSGTAGGGGLTFSRKSYVDLGGGWGEVRLGRDYTPAFWNLFEYDPFRVGVGMGTLTTHGTTVTSFRASNSIGYFTPGCSTFTCKGFFGQAMYAMGENPSGSATSNDGRYTGVRLGYGGAKWDIAAARGVTKNVAAHDYTQTNVGAYVDAGPAHLMAVWGEDKTGVPIAAMNNGKRARFWQIGARITVGPGYIPVAFTRLKRDDPGNGAADKIALGYVYNLSKRTALYATYARINNKNTMQLPVNAGADAGPTPLPGRAASGYDIGMRHTF